MVAAFVQHTDAPSPSREKPSDDDIRGWTRKVLGRHKAPVYVFWFGEEGVPVEVPQTGSGKVKKPDLRVLGEKVVRGRAGEPAKARL